MNVNMEGWKHKDTWTKRGENFVVSVEHWNESYDGSVFPEQGRCRWGVYVYIYPKHPMYAEFDGNDMFQSAACKLPLHCGPSLLQWHYSNGEKCSVQVGADYNHLNDDHFTHYDSPDEAYEVFSDAEELFGYMGGNPCK